MSSKNKNVLTENVGVTRKKTTMMNTNVQTKYTAAGTRRLVRNGSFLNPDLVYVFSNDFEYHHLDNVLAFTIKVQNVVQSSVDYLQDDRFVHLKFNAKDGEEKHNYTFYIVFNMNNAKILSVDVNPSETNIVLKLMLKMFNDIEYFMVGPNKDVLEKRYLNYTPNNNSEMELITPDYDVDVRYTDGKVSFILKPKESSKNSKLINKNKIAQKPKESFKKEAVTVSKHTTISRTKPKESSKKETVLDSKSTNKTHLARKPVVNNEKSPRKATQSRHLSVPKNLTKNTNDNMKVIQGRRFRSISASDFQSNDLPLKGILKKTSRYDRIILDIKILYEDGLSKSCDEASYPESRSFDETETPQTSKSFEAPRLPECPKKRVTFCDNVKTCVFRENSSILGQQRKNQKRKIQKQRAQQRRYSEGDATDQLQARTSTSYGISFNDSTPRRSPIADSDEDIFKFEM